MILLKKSLKVIKQYFPLALLIKLYKQVLQSKYSVHSAYYLGMTFINRGRIALLESRFHFHNEYCNVPTVALFQIRNADWFIIDIWRMFTCK